MRHMENIDGIVYLTIDETVELMGCTGGWVRKLLRAGKLPGRKIGERCWLIPRPAAVEARDGLTVRSVGRREPAKPAKKTQKRR